MRKPGWRKRKIVSTSTPVTHLFGTLGGKYEWMLRTWRHCADGLVALDQVSRIRAGHHGGTADGDVSDGRRGRVDQRAAVTGVQHDHGRTGADDSHSTAATSGGAHGARTAVTSRVPARALGLLAAAVRVMFMLVLQQMADAHGFRRSAPHLVYVLVVVLAGRRARVAASVGRRRAQVLVRPGAGTAVAAVHLHLDCGHMKIARKYLERAGRTG